MKEVWQTARKKYKVAKQAVIDAFEIITKEHEVKKGETEGTFVLVELMPKEEKKESDRMKRFCELKKKHSDAILLFRCGDFYEALEDDAVECAKILGITLTKSEKTGERMAGFPHHALDTYLPKLVRSGKRCAIVEELDAKPAVQKFEKAEHPGEVKEVKEEKKQPKHVLTEWEISGLAHIVGVHSEALGGSTGLKGSVDVIAILYLDVVVRTCLVVELKGVLHDCLELESTSP